MTPNAPSAISITMNERQGGQQSRPTQQVRVGAEVFEDGVRLVRLLVGREESPVEILLDMEGAQQLAQAIMGAVASLEEAHDGK